MDWPGRLIYGHVDRAWVSVFSAAVPIKVCLPLPLLPKGNAPFMGLATCSRKSSSMARLPCGGGPDVGHNHGGRPAYLHARVPWKQLQQEELLLFIEGFVCIVCREWTWYSVQSRMIHQWFRIRLNQLMPSFTRLNEILKVNHLINFYYKLNLFTLQIVSLHSFKSLFNKYSILN